MKKFKIKGGIVVQLATLVLAGALTWGHAAESNGNAKVEPQLLTEMAQKGEAKYLVFLRDKADLAGAVTIADRDERGRFVYQSLREVASRSQGPLLAYLQGEARAGRVREIRSFFSDNVIGVTSTNGPLQWLAGSPAVERIIREPVVSIPEPTSGQDEPKVQGVEWNIAKIRAPEVWARGIRGQGIVVATIDSGAQFDHPALVRQYRGNLGGMSFNHNYNWWDPSSVCGFPSNVPCDNTAHGTHVMGTIVGDDGGLNQIGVAPGAKWMACKGCETNSCSGFALFECGDFILAPWNLNRASPDPTRRPHVVNNSWAGNPGSSFYRGVVQNWRAAGIFPAFAMGNAGPLCGSGGSPGDYPESFGVGATDINDNIANFSGRGPSPFGGIKKPDVSAPGVNVRSSVPFNSYSNFNGTSMASPHTAGSVALIWEQFPSLRRDIPNTERKLRPAATILNTTQGCGGDGSTTHPNNVFGWGRIDAFQSYSPLNIYTNRSVYGPGSTMNVFLSYVNPQSVGANYDVYVVIGDPFGNFYFFPGFGMTPVPYVSNVFAPPLVENFDVNIFNYTWGGEPNGNYNWYTVLTVPGSNPTNPANWRSPLDEAPFRKQ